LRSTNPKSEIRNPKFPGGFTLVELLVVIAIIGILVALLLPAVQAAREAARRNQCKNGAKNIALGCLLHEDAMKYLPSGGWGRRWSSDANRGTGENQPGSWIYNILPYVEEQALHDLGKGSAAGSAAYVAALKQLNQSPIGLFQCPSRRAARIYVGYWPTLSTEHNSLTAVAQQGLAKSDYAGNAGDSQEWDTVAMYEPTSYSAAANGAWSITNYCKFGTLNSNLAHCQTGVMYYRSELKLSRITDGTSSTYLLGEKFVRVDGYEGAATSTSPGFTWGDNQSMYMGYDWDNHRVAFNPAVHVDPEAYFRPQQDRVGDPNYHAFGSAHSGGLNMTMCDGSVQFVSYDVDSTTHRWLANRFDGNVASIGATQ
jgi:prepilin-type N-terminal cleavage/methylation domain-containing protein/prepilin-type processing-associated H-X9-DG protein